MFSNKSLRKKAILFNPIVYMLTKINSIEEVKLFAQYLVNELHLNFHLEDDFSCYVNYDTKRPTFTPEEAAKYNALMDEYFDVCEKANVDVYEVMVEYLQKIVIA